MLRIILLCLSAASFITLNNGHAEETLTPTDASSPASSDPRQFVTMPEESRALMRQDMLSHLASLNEILSHLAANNLAAAAEVAEKRMGKSSMGKHRATGIGPGRYMPLEMRQLGWGMHEAASEFSLVAQQGNQSQAYSALQKITNACLACHYTYRTR